MYYAPSMEAILENIGRKPPPAQTANFQNAISFISSGDLLLSLQGNKSGLIGILFSQPQTELAQKQITQKLNYYHQRSGSYFDFYCCGYGGGWPPGEYPDQEEVAKVNGFEWFFSAQAFNELRERIEAKTKWEYSGRTDLLLLGSGYGQDGEPELGFSCALVCQLENLIEDRAITSVETFFEQICRFAQKYKGSHPVWDFSDGQGGKIAVSAFKDAILDLFPEKLRSVYKKAQHLAVRDISQH